MCIRDRGSRVPFALAERGLLPRKMAYVSPATRIPVWSVMLPSVWAGVLALSGSFDTLSDYMIFGGWIFYALTVVAVFVLRRKHPEWERPYRAWGYPLVPLVFLAVAAFLLVNTLYTQPQNALTGLALIALGLPVYAYYNRRRARTPGPNAPA